MRRRCAEAETDVAHTVSRERLVNPARLIAHRMAGNAARNVEPDVVFRDILAHLETLTPRLEIF